MKSALKKITKLAVGALAVLGLIFIILIVQWWPVIDRIYLRPCHYYPQAFIDC